MRNGAAIVKLGDVASIQSSLVDPRESAYRDLIHIGGANIKSGTGELIELKTAAEEGLRSGKYDFDESMVLYSKIRPYLRKVAFPQFRGVCSADIYPLSVNQERLNARYLYYVLLSESFTSYAISGSNRAGMPKVNRRHLFGYKFHLPGLAQQEQISARLDERVSQVAEIGDLRTKALAEARELLPSMLSDAFQQLVEEPSSTIGEIALETRYGTSEKCSTHKVGTAILRIPNVAEGQVNFDNLKYCPLGEEQEEKLRLKTGDLLFVRTNGSRDLVGRCAIFNDDEGGSRYAFASYLIRVRVDQSKVVPQYLAFFLNGKQGRRALDDRKRTSAGQFNINSTNLKSIGFPVPSIECQNELAEALKDVEATTRAMELELSTASEESAHLRQAVIERTLSEELR
jgi:type I restriction enzyme S subunit